MNRFFTTFLIFLFVSSPCFSCIEVVAHAESIAQKSETMDGLNHSENLSNTENKGSNVSSKEISSESSDSTDTQENRLTETIEKTDSDGLPVHSTSEAQSHQSAALTNSSHESEHEPKHESEELTITFQTSAGQLFENGGTSLQVSKKKGERLTATDIPSFKNPVSFAGWQLEGKIYSNKTLQEVELVHDQTIQAAFKQSMSVRSIGSLAEQSIKEILASADTSRVIAVPSPAGDGRTYAEYANNVDGLRQALFDMYQNGAGGEFALYVGSGGTLSLPESLTAKTIPSTIDNTNITFYALQGKVSRLILTGHANDPITDATTLPSGSRRVDFSTNNYFGSDIVFRNIDYRGSTIYMNGHSLSLNGGAVGNGFTIYGGTNNGDLEGNPTINVNNTGSGVWNIYGGNQSGGTLTGNVTININNTVSGFSTIAGGANVGTIDGNTHVVIRQLNGTLTNYYGGGVGSSAANTANVTGNVATTIATENASFRLGTFVGGVQYGTIAGSINSTVSGNGGWTGTANRFVGGSYSGNVGSESTKDAIVTDLDSSVYSTGRATYEGGNRYSGTIKGNIVNTVKAGPSASIGGIGDFNGGGGNDVSKLSQSSMGASNTTAYDNYTPAQRAQLAETGANFKVYGNITSHLVSGSFSNGATYTTAAGRGGYIDGNTTIEVGTITADGSPGGDGIAYKGSKPTNLAYSTTTKNRGELSGWDIVGGGGEPGTAWNIYIKGNTKTILNNTVARWTYGGSFSGVIEGNASNTLNSGIVDTLEGTGYTGRRVYGNGETTVNNGQVDWFLSGGGWNDLLIGGNVAVTVYDGVINASLGASYGDSTTHTINGNSNNRIFGGNFSGTPRTGSNGFSGGVTNNGRLLGNASLTVDLRNYEGEFKLPSGTSISGGNPFNSTNIVGTDTSNTITLNIYTKPGSDVLNGATIYGDGGRTASNTRSGKIMMNIQAEDSSIGNLYTTNYSNISSNQILRDVEMRIQGAKSINGISGGNATDNFTNAIVANSTNQVKINVGENVDGTNAYQDEPIAMTGLGLVNFTELTVTNGLTLMANGGDIKNGRLATAANHRTDYHQFGTIQLAKNAGIGISSANHLISGSRLTIEDEATIESPPGTGRINLSDFEVPDPAKDHLTWIKNTANDAATRVISQGTWFGEVTSYQVLTVNPVANNVTTITPITFSGIEKSTGKTFIGDNDVTGVNGYGIAIPGSVIDYEVEMPGIADGQGSITHDVTGVKESNAPLVIPAWGTDVAGLPVQKGRLLIPYTESDLPTLTFTPETQHTGSWFYAGQIQSSKIASETETIPEQATSNPVDWQIPDGEYSYQVKVSYSNQAELHAQNAIITEQEAENLTREEVLDYLQAQGRPFLTDSLTEEALAEIQEPLGTAVSRKHLVSFKTGAANQSSAEQTVNLVVVKNESALASNRQFAVYAKDSRLTLGEATSITNQADLAAYTEAVTIFADDRDEQLPQAAPEALKSIQQTTAEELLKNVATTYHFTENGQTAEKTVNVAIAGELTLSSVPTTIDFGEQKITTTTQTYWPDIQGDLIVKDTRGAERSSWRLTVKEQQCLSNGKDRLDNTMFFVKNGKEQLLTNGEIIVEERESTENGDYLVNQDWGETRNKGLKLVVPVEKQKIGEYSGTLSWQLVSAPGNP